MLFGYGARLFGVDWQQARTGLSRAAGRAPDKRTSEMEIPLVQSGGADPFIRPQPSRVSGFHVMAKPTGPACNLVCKYCFYLEKSRLYADVFSWRMPDAALESFIRQYIEGQRADVINFAWQGGEPTLLGIDYFQKAVALQKKYAGGKQIASAFQTNGILLNEQWAEFLAKNKFLVGVSIDGPRSLHDRYRVDKGGQPTFGRVRFAEKRGG